ncbi:MAG: zf-TFIIB domain-containing protein [Phycisphaerales bacterium]
MNCPACHANMRSMQYEGVTIETCDGCGGEFLDADELGHIVRLRDEKFPEEAKRLLAECPPVFGVPADESARSLNCPKCSGAMRVMNYCGDSGIHVDRCEGCGGFWLDADELEHVQIYQEEWEAKGPAMIQKISAELERARRETAERTSNAFSGSRFAFVNALINRFLDAA